MNKVKMAGVLLVALSFQVNATAFRFDAGFDANTFARNDDGSIFVNTGMNYDFFGITGNSLYINNNGNVTFNNSLGAFTPFGITSGSTPMLAPFFADVDTRGIGDAVTYGNSTVNGRNAFGVNWDNVGHYSNGSPLNSFQLVMIDRSDTGAGNFDFEFNYDSILWEAGTASGSNALGLGGVSAHVGYTNGAGSYLELAGSGVNGALLDYGPSSLVANSLNTTVAGRYLFTVRNGNVVTPTAVSEPGIIALFAFGLVGLSLVSRRNKRKV